MEEFQVDLAMLGTTGFGELPLIGADAMVDVWAGIGQLDVESLPILEQVDNFPDYFSSSVIEYQFEGVDDLFRLSNHQDGYYHGKTVQQPDPGGRISNYIVIMESVTAPPVSEMLDAWIVPIDEPVTLLQNRTDRS